MAVLSLAISTSYSLLYVFLLQAQMKLKHAQQELKTKQTEIKKMDSGYRKDQEALEDVKKLKEKLETEMKRLNYEGLPLKTWC